MTSVQPDLESVVRAHGPGLLKLATVLTGNRQDGEDVVEEVFLKAHRQWNRLSQVDQLLAYLRKMILNECLTRRRKRVYEVHLDELINDRGPYPDLAATVAARRALIDALKTLPAIQRSTLALRYYGGLSDAEISVLLGSRVSTVRSNASRALTTLRANRSLTE